MLRARAALTACRVAARLRDDVDAVAFPPDGELFTGSGAEGVARSKKYGLSFIGKALGELADCGGFASTIHAAHHDDEGFGARRVEDTFSGFQQRRQLAGNGCAHFGLSFEALEFNVVADAL